MEIVIDTHALYWYLTENPTLSKKALQAIEEADTIVVPTIVLMEMYYLFKKHNTLNRFVELLAEMQIRTYAVYPLNVNVIVQAMYLDESLEMHDRIIVATAKMHSMKLITKDSIITKVFDDIVW